MELVDREIRRCENLTNLWLWHRRQFLLLAEGSVTTMDDSHHSVADSRAPKDAGMELRDLDYRWAGCGTNKDRREVLRDAQTTLRHFLVPRADSSLVRGTVDWRRAVALDDNPEKVVARKYKVSRSTVTRCRREFAEERLEVVTA